MGRITIFTEECCPKSDLVKTTLDDKNIPYTEINLRSHPKRRPDMIGLCDSVLTPQVFFNSDLVGSDKELIKLMSTWDKESKFGGYSTLRQRVKIETLSAASPRDKRLRSPRTKEQSNEIKSDKPEQINGITLPNGTTMDACKMTHILMNYLPRSKIVHKTKLFYNASSGRALIDTLKKLNIVDTHEEAINVSQKLLDLRVINSLSKCPVFDAKAGYYRLQPLHDPTIMNSFCFWISYSGTGEALKNPLMVLRSLSNMMKTIIEKSIFKNSKKIDRKAAKKSNLYSNFEKEVCKLQLIDVENLDLRAKVAFFINLYNLMVIHVILRLDTGTLTPKHLTSVKYNVGGYLLSLDDIEHGILRGNNPKPGKKSKQFFQSDARKKLSLPGKDRRIHFALNHGGAMSLGSYQYTREAIDLELRLAAELFCAMDDRVKVDENKKELMLPWFMKIYLQDFCTCLGELPDVVAGYLKGEKLAKFDKLMTGSKDTSRVEITIKFEGLESFITYDNTSTKSRKSSINSKKLSKKKNLIHKDTLIVSNEGSTQMQEIPETISVGDQFENNSIGEYTQFTFDIYCTSDKEVAPDEFGSHQDPLDEDYFTYSNSPENLVEIENKMQTPNKPMVGNKIVSPSERTLSTGEVTALTEVSTDSKSIEQVEVSTRTVPLKFSSIEYDIDEIDGVSPGLKSAKNGFEFQLNGIPPNSSTLTDNSGVHSSNSNDIVSRLTHLVSLKNMGALTSEEFKAAKSVVIAEGKSGVQETKSMNIPSFQEQLPENVTPYSFSNNEANNVPSVSYLEDEVSLPSFDDSLNDLEDILNLDDSVFRKKQDEDDKLIPTITTDDDDNDSLFSDIFDSEIEKMVLGMQGKAIM